MAFEADCGASTVPETVRVASTAGLFLPGEFREGRVPHSSRRATVAWRPRQKISVLFSVLSVPLWFSGG